MKTINDQLEHYARFHRNRWNKLTHVVGVPVITFSILIPMAWLRTPLAGVEISLGIVFVMAVLVYYFLLDTGLGLVAAALILPPWMAAEQIATGMPVGHGALWFVVAFTSGWMAQLIGHVIEGRRPALMTNLFQIFIAPLFLAAEFLFLFGPRKALARTIAPSS